MMSLHQSETFDLLFYKIIAKFTINIFGRVVTKGDGLSPVES